MEAWRNHAKATEAAVDLGGPTRARGLWFWSSPPPLTPPSPRPAEQIRFKGPLSCSQFSSISAHSIWILLLGVSGYTLSFMVEDGQLETQTEENPGHWGPHL